MSLSCRNLTVRFGDTAALAGADIDVPSGEVVAVMGPSGSGKSTLLRVVAGLQHPDTGTVQWDGAPLDDVPPHQRGFGLMFQDYALFPHRTVARNVAFGLEMAGEDAPAIDARVSEMLEIVGLGGYGDREIEGLSGGEQQRVALARTLAPAPRLVMLDEPVGSLDRQLRERIVVDMRRIFTDLDVTALYVTHDREEAFEIADRVAVMRSGNLVRIDEPETLWNDPQSRFLASFLGHDNILPVHTDADGTTRVAGIPVAVATGTGSVAVATDAVDVIEPAPHPTLPSPPGDQWTTGEIVGSVYRGAGYRTEITIGGETVVATTPDRHERGNEVMVVIDPTGVMALED